MKQDATALLTELLQIQYSLPNLLIERPEDGIEGNTYIITAEKHKYVAKVYVDQQQAKVIAEFQNTVHESGVPVPAIVKTQTGELVAKLNNQYMVLCEFAQGSPIGWRKEFANMHSSLSHDIAKALAKMHHVGQSMTEVKLTHALSAVDRLSDFVDNDALNSLALHDLERVRQTMIHGDLTRENVFVDPATSNLTAVIDFGDAHYDYITYDIATALTQIYVTKSWGIDFDGIKDFLAAYTQHTSLTQNERQTILPLMMFRNIILLREIEHQLTQERSDREDLESMVQSLQTKLRLLKEHNSEIKSIFE